METNSVGAIAPRLRQAWSWIAFLLVMAALGALLWLVDSLIAGNFPNRHGHWRIGIYIAIGINVFAFVFNEPLVILIMGCRRVRRREQNPKLWDAVHTVCENAWVAVPPRIYVVHDSGCNAFAFGWGIPFMSAVAATSGIINELEDHELRGVMAHEVAHVVNKDIICAITLSVMIGAFAIGGEILFRSMLHSGSGNSSSRSKRDGGNGMGILILLAIGFTCFAISKVVGPLLQMLISRIREYGADALGARFAGDAQGLASALEKITGKTVIRRGGAVNYLCFRAATDDHTYGRENDDLTASHPRVRNRVAALMSLQK